MEYGLIKMETFFSLVCFAGILAGATFVSNPNPTEDNCIGRSQNMPWRYDKPSNNLPLRVTWKKSVNTILTYLIGTNQLIPATGYGNGKITHEGNGNITLNNLSPSNTGSYSCEVTYTSGDNTVSRSLVLTVYDEVRTNLTCQHNDTIISCNVPHSSIRLQINGNSVSMPFSPPSGGTYEICMFGGASACLADGIDRCVFVGVEIEGHTTTAQDLTLSTSTKEEQKTKTLINELKEFFQQYWWAIAGPVVLIILVVILVFCIRHYRHRQENAVDSYKMTNKDK